MKISFVSILVSDQEQALQFYRDKLGFVVTADIPMGAARWLTLAAPDQPEGANLSLEPVSEDFVRDYQSNLFKRNIPLTSFQVQNLDEEYARLTDRGVEFAGPPAQYGNTAFARFKDTVGNWVQLHEVSEE